ncbi:MAG: alkene reductase [Pseudomonadota bacterium]|jgi:N-ethylmaleimide reductase
MTNLFEPLQAGAIPLPNRIVMAALTRSRAGRRHVPNDLMRTYYAQRASAGLILSEATMVAADACAFTAEGGIYDDETAAGWKGVVDAVHAAGGRIAVQLWHPGRAAHSSISGGAQPVSATGRAIRNDTINTPNGPQAYEVPRRLGAAEVPAYIELFRQAAIRARASGFDGVEVHGAHGYLIDQFLRDGANDRTDEWGGPIANRARFLLAVVDAVAGVFGADRVGVRISPLSDYNDMVDSSPPELVAHVARELNHRGIAFLDLRHVDQSAPAERELARIAREHFRGALLLGGGFDAESAEAAVADGRADAIVFGYAYVGNPDLVERVRRGAPFNAVDASTLYTPGAKGYTDYPTLAEAEASTA